MELRKRKRNQSLSSSKRKKEESFPGLARWTERKEDGGLIVRKNKIKGIRFVKDQETRRRLLEGVEISRKVFPILIEKSDHPKAKYRTLSFLSELCCDRALFYGLEEEEQMYVGVAIRDLFLACDLEISSPSDFSLLERVCNVIGHFTIAKMDGISISFFPTRSQKLHRHIKFSSLPEEISEKYSAYFARSGGTFVKTCYVFVDPEELSYHNYENILPIDCFFEKKLEEEDSKEEPLSFSLTNMKSFEEKEGVVSFTLTGSTDSLLDLDKLDLYNPPFNKESRGGKRFIFQSSCLSQALSEAIKKTGHFAPSFRFVNYVFRLNKFDALDRKFESHFDTPYYDASNNHISRYTFLIYLTGGKGDPALRLEEDLFFNQIDEMTCLIFPQDLEHEGKPYNDGTKMFIRTELIFEEPLLDHNSVVGSVFAKAVYMTGESIFKKELASYTQKCYDRVAGLHWNLQSPRPLADSEESKEAILHKEFSGIHFLTNGYDYWFSQKVDLPKACVLTLMDYFNCMIGEVAFRKLVKSQILDSSTFLIKEKRKRGRRKAGGKVKDELVTEKGDWRTVLKRLNLHGVESSKDESFTSLDEILYSNETNLMEICFDVTGSSSDEEDEDNENCCPYHGGRPAQEYFCERVDECFDMCVNYSKRKLSDVAFSFFGEKVCVDERNIVQKGNKIYVSLESENELPPVNFASCNIYISPTEFVSVSKTSLKGHLFTLPPILVSQSEEFGHHLMFDLFRNDWMVKQRAVLVPVPTLDSSKAQQEDFVNMVNPDFAYGDDEELYSPSESDESEEDEVMEIKPARRGKL